MSYNTKDLLDNGNAIIDLAEKCASLTANTFEELGFGPHHLALGIPIIIRHLVGLVAAEGKEQEIAQHVCDLALATDIWHKIKPYRNQTLN